MGPSDLQLTESPVPRHTSLRTTPGSRTNRTASDESRSHKAITHTQCCPASGDPQAPQTLGRGPLAAPASDVRGVSLCWPLRSTHSESRGAGPSCAQTVPQGVTPPPCGSLGAPGAAPPVPPLAHRSRGPGVSWVGCVPDLEVSGAPCFLQKCGRGTLFPSQDSGWRS